MPKWVDTFICLPALPWPAMRLNNRSLDKILIKVSWPETSQAVTNMSTGSLNLWQSNF